MQTKGGGEEYQALGLESAIQHVISIVRTREEKQAENKANKSAIAAKGKTQAKEEGANLTKEQ